VLLRPYAQDDETIIDLDKRAIKSFAGIVAEARHTGSVRWRYGTDDFAGAYKIALVRNSEGTLSEVEAYLKFAWVRTHAFVDHPYHWAAIAAVANALLRRKRLPYEEVKKVINDVLAPLYLARGEPRSWVEENLAMDGNRLAFLQFLMRRGLRRLRVQRFEWDDAR